MAEATTIVLAWDFSRMVSMERLLTICPTIGSYMQMLTSLISMLLILELKTVLCTMATSGSPEVWHLQPLRTTMNAPVEVLVFTPTSVVIR